MSNKLTSPKQEQGNTNHYQQHDNSFASRRQMTSHLPPFNMPPAPRTFSPTPGFKSEQEQQQQQPQQHSMSSQKYPPGSGSNMNPSSAAMPSPPPGQGQGEYGNTGGQNAPQGYMNTGMNYWPTSVPNNPQNSGGPVPFPHHQNPSHLPSVYGNISQQQGYPYPPRPGTGSSQMQQRAGSPHTESSGNAPLPPPQAHDSFGQPGQQQPGGGNSGNYPMYMPQYGQQGSQQGPGNLYGGPSAPGYGGYPAQPYGGPGNSQQYPGMYSNAMPHSREGSQDNPNWNRSPYGPTPSYGGPGGMNPGYGGNQFAPAPMAQQPYNAGRAGRGASHTGERPFKCDQCPQSFQRSHDLKRHKRIHLAIKPFPCPSCDKSFSRKDALKRHILVKGCGSNGAS